MWFFSRVKVQPDQLLFCECGGDRFLGVYQAFAPHQSRFMNHAAPIDGKEFYKGCLNSPINMKIKYVCCSCKKEAVGFVTKTRED